MPISVVFDPPLPSDSPSTFNTKSFTLLGDLNNWSTQANALPGEVATNLSALLAAPPAIGSTTPAAGSFTTLNASGTTTLSGAVDVGGVLTATLGNKVQFDRPDGTNQFALGYTANDLLLRLNFNGGSSLLTVDNTGAVTIPGSVSSGKHTVKQSGDSSLASLGLVVERFANDTFISLGYDSVSDSSRIYTSYSSTGAYKPLTLWTGDAERVRIDTSGNATFNSGTFGYGVGAGGTAIQATSKSTAVTLNKPSGQITMNNAALAAGDVVRFAVNNSFVTATSLVDVIVFNTITGGAYQAWIDTVTSGIFVVCVRNISSGSLSDAVGLTYQVHSGASS